MGDELFEGPETIGEVLDSWRRKALADITALPSELLRSESPDELEAEVLERWRVNPLALDWDAMAAEPSEIATWDGTEPGEVSGTKVTLFVPFTGPAGFFHLRPTTHLEDPPRGSVRGGESLLLNYSYASADRATVARELDQQVAAVKEIVSSINSDVDAYNAELSGLIHGALKARLDKLDADDETVSALGVPRRERRTGSRSGIEANRTGPGLHTRADRCRALRDPGQ